MGQRTFSEIWRRNQDVERKGAALNLRGQQVKAEFSQVAELGNSRKQREHTPGGGLGLEIFKVCPWWHTSISEATPPKPSQVVPQTGHYLYQVFKRQTLKKVLSLKPPHQSDFPITRTINLIRGLFWLRAALPLSFADPVEFGVHAEMRKHIVG